MTRIVLLNSPGGGGKDVAANHLCLKLGMIKGEFKQKIFDVAIPASLMSKDEWCDIYENRTDPDKPNKETPLDNLGGLSQRQLMIKTSEEWMKSVHGKDVFGKAAVEYVKSRDKDGSGKFVFSDCGIAEEVPPLIEAFGKENVMIVHIYRKGHTFEGDSRNYIPFEMVDIGASIFNNGTLSEFKDIVVKTVRGFVEGGY